MISTTYARVLAIPVSFPQKPKLRFEAVDQDTGEDLGVLAPQRLYSWDEVKREFPMNEVIVEKCQNQCTRGEAGLVSERRKCEANGTRTEVRIILSSLCSSIYVLDAGLKNP
jgi:hypothetical protein